MLNNRKFKANIYIWERKIELTSLWIRISKVFKTYVENMFILENDVTHTEKKINAVMILARDADISRSKPILSI